MMVLEALMHWVYSSPEITWTFFLVSFFLVGLLLKFVDAALDDGLASKKRAFVIACLLAVVGAALMVISDMTMIAFTGVLLGVIIARKVDNLTFVAGTFLCAAVFFILGGTIQPLLTNTPVFAIIFLAIVLEEKVDYKKEKWFKTKKGKAFSFFFEYGFMLKIAAFVAFMILTFQPLFFLALLLFDFGYDAMLIAVHKKLGKGILWV